MRKRVFRIGLILSEVFLALLLVWDVVIPYGWSKVFTINYFSKLVYIPATKETLYLIKFNPRLDPDLYHVQLSTCDWSFYDDENREYWYYSIYGGEIPCYYKVSNDTLYLTMRYVIEAPKKWNTKVKIIQNVNTYMNADGKLDTTYFDLFSVKECRKWEELGYTRYP